MHSSASIRMLYIFLNVNVARHACQHLYLLYDYFFKYNKLLTRMVQNKELEFHEKVIKFDKTITQV